MRKLIKNFLWVGALLLTLPSAWGFSLSGLIGNKGDSWQTITIGYGWDDPVAPKDFKEGYRPVVPVLYYASDVTFLSYYGAAGLTNIDAAFAILNGAMCGHTNSPIVLSTPTNGIYVSPSGITNGGSVTLSAANTLDKYSADLTEFSQASQQINYTAQAAGLMDIKSLVLHTVVLDIGLADPDRYVWTLHNRVPDPFVLNPKCPQDEQYLVVQRNYDVNPLQNYPYSPYINGTLYTFLIDETCGKGVGVPWSAMTVPYPADPFASSYTAVASGGLLTLLSAGEFYMGLTRDDVAGLKYLLSSNAINWEATAPSGSQLFTISTNFTTPQLFPGNGTTNGTTTGTNTAGFYYYDGTYGYGDLMAFLAFAKTNNQAAVQAAYPGVVVSSVSTTWVNATNVTYTSYYTNAPIGSPYGTPPQLVVVPTYQVYPQFVYNYSFANVFTNLVQNHRVTNAVATLQTSSYSAPIGSPYGAASTTNTTVKLTNSVAGDFFVFPSFYTGVCPVDFASSAYVKNVQTTTQILSGGGTNLSGISYSNTVSLTTYFTNYYYVVYPVTCASGSAAPALRRGIGRVEFIRANYDSLLGQYFQPQTNNYSMVMITNGQPVTEYYQRVVEHPDFLFSAEDMTIPAPPVYPYGLYATVPTPNFDQSAIQGNLAGPGTIIPGGMQFTFNKNLNSSLYLNGSLNNYGYSTNQFLNQGTQVSLAQFYGTAWGSFDDSTNLPVVYPDSSSLASLMNQVVVQITPASVPDGTNGVAYNGGSGVTFTATGGQPPYTWTAPNLSALVPGMSFNSVTATLAGTPTAAGIYTFPLQLTDSANRVVSVNYLITIH